jgi:hypothetical protein
MRAAQPVVVVGVDDSPAADAALRWALNDAATRHAGIRLVTRYRPQVTVWPAAIVPPERMLAEKWRQRYPAICGCGTTPGRVPPVGWRMSEVAPRVGRWTLNWAWLSRWNGGDGAIGSGSL